MHGISNGMMSVKISCLDRIKTLDYGVVVVVPISCWFLQMKLVVGNFLVRFCTSMTVNKDDKMLFGMVVLRKGKHWKHE